MSFTIDEAFVTKFQSDWHYAAAQQPSRLERFVTNKGQFTGEAMAIDVLNSADATELIARHQDTPFMNTPNSRRFADVRDFVWADLVDRQDQAKTLVNPTNGYSRRSREALNRKKDQTIIDCLSASIRTKTGTAALPGTQIIAQGGTALTLAKIRQAVLLLNAAEMDDSGFFQQNGLVQAQPSVAMPMTSASFVIALSAKQMDALLGDSNLTDQDFNVVKALVSGTVNTFLNCFFVRTELLPFAASNRKCYVWAPRAIEYGYNIDPNVIINQRPDKNNAWQVYAEGSFASGRAEDLGVVEINCLES